MNLLSGHLSVLSPREAVAELRVCELVEPTGSRDAEVSPDVLTGPEVQLLHRPGTRLETLSDEEQNGCVLCVGCNFILNIHIEIVYS